MSQKKTNVSTNVSITPNGKKLIQARLPFKTLASTPKVGIDSLGTAESRKRKLSTTDDDNRSTSKLIKTSGAKENINKTDEVAVLEIVDSVDDDIVLIDNEKSPSAEQTKQTKKSTKAVDVEEAEVSVRRSNRKNDSEVAAKVIIKIPSTKKKKMNGRQSKVATVTKIVEVEDDDDDVIPLDSEENSLDSDNGKEKAPKDTTKHSIVLIEDDKGLVADDKGSESKIVDKVADSVANLEGKEDSHIKSVDSSSIPINKEEHISTTVENQAVSSEDTEMVKSDGFVGMEIDGESVSQVEIDTNKLDGQDEEVLSSNDNTEGKENDEADVKEENPLASADKSQTAASEVIVDNNVEDELVLDSDQINSSTLASSTGEKETNELTDDSEATKTPAPKTPAPKTRASKTPAPTTPVSKSSDSTSLTPKQLQKKLDSETKRLAKEKAKEERERKIQEAKEERERKLQEVKEERERKIQEAKEERERKIQEAKEERERKIQEAKEERERKLQEEKEQKQRERDEKERLKKKEREDKEEQRRKEKEEREKKKQAEIDAKNEEKRQKEEEKIAKEEAEMKKKRKEAEAFTKFFAKKSNKLAESDKMEVDDVESKLNFMPFRIKPDMRLAPIVRRKLSPTRKTKFEAEVFNSSQDCPSTDLYILTLRNGRHVSEKQGKTWPIEDNSEDVMIIDDLESGTPIEETAIQKYRAKFFKFEENRRPPYYGTWQKKSSVIKPRRPFVTDQKYFDYEIDSDDEWEDEEPGESLHGSDDEKDKESDDDYDIDNEFFVPHGHLSDEEMANNDDIDDDNTPDTQKAKLKIMQKVFSDEMKKKTEKIKPRLIGLIWQNKDGSQPQACPDVIWEMLQMRSMIFNGHTIVIPTTQLVDKNDALDENGESKRTPAVKKRSKLTDEVVPDLIRLIHGNTNSSEFLSKEFRAFIAQKNKDNDNVQELFISSIRHKIKELAEWKPCPEEGPLMNKYCWYVSNEHRNNYKMENLPIINDWSYILTPKTKSKTESKKVKDSDKGKSQPEVSDEPPTAAKTPKSKLGNIAKFTKVLSEDEKKKNFSIPIQEPPESASLKPKVVAEPSPKPVKKRVNLLMSVPRGQEINVQAKNSLISQYLSNAKSNKNSTNDDEPICID